MRDFTAMCTGVLSGDTIRVDGGITEVRYCNVWAPPSGTPLGDALLAYNRELVLGKQIRYVPNGHIHWDGVGIIAEVYVDGVWLNQLFRNWLGARMGKAVWVDGIPNGADPNQTAVEATDVPPAATAS